MRPVISLRCALLPAALIGVLMMQLAMANEHPPKISVSYADPIVQGRYEHVLRKNGVTFKYTTLQGQKAVLIEGLTPRQIMEKTREFDEWVVTYRAPTAADANVDSKGDAKGNAESDSKSEE